jgi:hypothetical protein
VDLAQQGAHRICNTYRAPSEISTWFGLEGEVLTIHLPHSIANCPENGRV